jgi:hypothetical protein
MFANRPLNARTSIGTLRIATYQEDIKKLNEQRDSQIFDALDFRKQMVGAGYIKPGDDRALALIACESYLAAGIDHVLVGMRTVSYVDDLKSLLSPRPTRTSVE